MSKLRGRKIADRGKGETRTALISAGATILAALITGIFGLIHLNSNQETPADLAPPTVIASPEPDAANSSPEVRIEGPLLAPLGKPTYYTILSQNGTRAEWSIGGFQDNESFVIDPLPPSYQIFVEPTDETRVGERFTIVVAVYDEAGQSAMASQEFQIVLE